SSSGCRLSLTLVVTAVLAAPAWAQDPADVLAGPARLSRMESAGASTISYWTAERMQTARSLDVLLAEGTMLRTQVPAGLRSLAGGEALLASSGGPGARPTQITGEASVSKLLGPAKALDIEPQLGSSPFNFSRYRLFPEPPRDPSLMYRVFPY